MSHATHWTRRQLLRSTLAGLSVAGAGTALAAVQRATELPVHERAAAAARALSGDTATTLNVLLPEGSESNFEPIARQFTAMTGVQIVSRQSPVDEINSLLLLGRLAGRRQFDLALPATFGIPDLAEADALQPLDAFAAKHEPTGFQRGSLYNLGDYYQGKLYGYQADGDVYLMFYNAAFLNDGDAASAYADRFGQALQLPATWPELDRQMAFFHQPEKQRYGGTLFRTPRYVAWEFWMRLHSKGVLPFDADMRPQIDGDAGVAALQELTNASNYLCPDCTSNNLFQNWQAFARGDSFCNVGWGGSQKYFQQHPENFTDGLRYSHAPGGDPGASDYTVSFFNWGWNYAVPSGARHPELAYLLALFAASPAMSTLAVQQPDGYFDPIRDAHYDDPQIREVYSPAFLDAHRKAMHSAVPDLYLHGQSEYFEVLSDYILRADRHLVTPRQAMSAVAKLWEETTDRLGRDVQIRQWRALRARYPARLRQGLQAG
jgi:multiple sugar transport system substrate-binding protein